MATKKAPSENGNGKRWNKVERKRYRFWKVDDDSSSLIGFIRAREEKNGRFGMRHIYVIDVTEAGEDRKGPYEVGTLMALGETATLRDLHQLIGKEVKIDPAGVEKTSSGGLVKLFDVAVAD